MLAAAAMVQADEKPPSLTHTCTASLKSGDMNEILERLYILMYVDSSFTISMLIRKRNSVDSDVFPSSETDNAWKKQFPSPETTAGNRRSETSRNAAE